MKVKREFEPDVLCIAISECGIDSLNPTKFAKHLTAMAGKYLDNNELGLAERANTLAREIRENYKL